MVRKITLGLLAGASSLLCVNAAQAQDFVLGQTLLVGFDFCPYGTMEADGRLLPIPSNTALFSLIGVTYGGDGKSNFALPNLQGRVPINHGNAPGLPFYQQGAMAGTETQTLTMATMPMHIHSAWSVASTGGPTIDNPNNAAPATYNVNPKAYSGATANVSMKAGTVVLNNAGGGQPFNMLDPVQTLRYCVVTRGVYPRRS